jgi:hypothetical protein
MLSTARRTLSARFRVGIATDREGTESPLRRAEGDFMARLAPRLTVRKLRRLAYHRK